ncbi:putative cupredoxin [Lupinus albus]|uniref:Putative cupredoxin n=1 Tax=Lupinus albus TaxID=3870 RepID=A0A6A4NGS8_LUPAL|nr:putative cupredoxin [Lupinus albus]
MSGPFYFISGTEDHCTNGQKLLVEVMSPHPIPKSSPPLSHASDDTLEDSISASASVVLGPVPVASIVTFVIMLLLTTSDGVFMVTLDN